MKEQSAHIDLKTSDLQLLTADQAWHYRVIPKEQNGDEICLYIDEGADQEVGDELELLLGIPVVLEKLDSSVVGKTLSKYYRRDQKQRMSGGVSFSGNSESFVQDLIEEAKNLGSSDIHLEIYEETCRVRIRIDGMMVERGILNKDDYPAIVNKIKILANLDIAEKRLPQDGRIFFQKDEEKFDIRVSVLPTLHGEKVVMRLLSQDATNIDIKALGFSDFDLDNFMEGVRRPNGIVLISGPTGSGKTTTLYATLKILNEETRNILTIEDPIEYTLEGINQVQLKESIGLGFASALRTFLRQDPDVIMVGEIRDVDTAGMAIRAALTGHLVLSTIHTNSAWGTISRLIDMNVPPFLLANTLNTSVAQRLVRLLCEDCKEKETFSEKLYPKSFRPYRKVEEHYVAKGCDNCFYTGYRGRKAVYEIIPVDRTFSELIKKNEHDISLTLKEKQIKTLAENAFGLFEQGKTTINEIYPLLFNF